MSVITSVYHHILPNGLLFDERGTVYLFVVVLRGKMFDARFDEQTNSMIVEECEYACWWGKIPVPLGYYRLQIDDAVGNKVPFSDAMYWFGDQIWVEFVADSALAGYLKRVELAFQNLDMDSLSIMGKPWKDENFPKLVGKAPILKPAPKLSGDHLPKEPGTATKSAKEKQRQRKGSKKKD